MFVARAAYQLAFVKRKKLVQLAAGKRQTRRQPRTIIGSPFCKTFFDKPYKLYRLLGKTAFVVIQFQRYSVTPVFALLKIGDKSADVFYDVLLAVTDGKAKFRPVVEIEIGSKLRFVQFARSHQTAAQAVVIINKPHHIRVGLFFGHAFCAFVGGMLVFIRQSRRRHVFARTRLGVTLSAVAVVFVQSARFVKDYADVFYAVVFYHGGKDVLALFLRGDYAAHGVVIKNLLRVGESIAATFIV